ncbi:VWA domain-containing protein [Candidatus Poribacteria bacterium]|nr:VWA domain-containing protein [Candidatus Poribacteria bacterium]
MGFLNPFLLFGILAAAAPLLIHLWSRRQAKTIDFSSLMLLFEAHRRSVSRLQLKNLLILVLRMLIVVFTALALARPLLKNAFSFAGARMKTSCVIVLDNSYSMDYTGIAGRRFDIAKEKALESIDSLKSGDNASLILMSDIADVVFRKLTTDLQQVREAIQNARVSQRTTQVLPALQAAEALLAKSDNPNKEIYLITDLCRNGWENWKRITPDARVFVIAVGESKADNVAIEEVHFKNQLIGVNIPVKLEAKIHNFSDTSLKDVTLKLFIDDEKRREISVSVPKNESTVQPFTHRFDLPGTHIGRLEITNDRLTIDDTRYFAINVYGQIKVLCAGEQTLYLTLALNPTTSVSPALNYSIMPTASSLKDLSQIPYDEYDVIIIDDSENQRFLIPNSDEWELIQQKLYNFVRNGKSVVLFVGDNVDTGLFASLAQIPPPPLRKGANNNFSDFMPAKFGKVNNFANPLKLTQYDQQHPIFGVFNPESLTGANAPNFYKAYTLSPFPDSKNIAVFDNGIPAIVERKIGWGKVILFNTSASDANWSNLCLNPNFVPLLQQTIFYATSSYRIADKNIFVGDVYSESLRGKGSTEAKIQPLSSNNVTFTVPASGSDNVENPDFIGENIKFDKTTTAGIYLIEIQTDDKIYRDFFAVNVDTRESDLSALSEEEVLRKLGQASFVKKSDQFAKTIDSYRIGKEIFGELLILAVVLMLVEVVLANHERKNK